MIVVGKPFCVVTNVTVLARAPRVIVRTNVVDCVTAGAVNVTKTTVVVGVYVVTWVGVKTVVYPEMVVGTVLTISCVTRMVCGGNVTVKTVVAGSLFV